MQPGPEDTGREGEKREKGNWLTIIQWFTLYNMIWKVLKWSVDFLWYASYRQGLYWITTKQYSQPCVVKYNKCMVGLSMKIRSIWSKMDLQRSKRVKLHTYSIGRVSVLWVHWFLEIQFHLLDIKVTALIRSCIYCY